MENTVSKENFYHDRALDCFLKLASSEERHLYHRMRGILNVKEQSLCEVYWSVIARNTDSPEFEHFKLAHLLENHFVLYSDSIQMRQAMARCLNRLPERSIQFFRCLCQIFSRNENHIQDQETSSFCAFGVLDYLS